MTSSASASSRIAILGVGRMGAALVQRWSKAGRHLAIWNRTEAAARVLESERVRVAPTAAQAVEAADVVVTMLTNGPALRSVLIDHGVIQAMRSDAVLVDLSTVDLESSRQVWNVAEERGIAFVRGAVSGTPSVVTAGASTLLLSGDKTSIEQVQPYLSEITDSIRIVGDEEQARVIKIAINSMLAGTMQMLAEAMLLAESLGVSREELLPAIEASVIGSRFTSYKGAALQNRDYSATFTVEDMMKDVNLALSHANSVNLDMAVSKVALSLLEKAIASGYADQDFSAVVKVLQVSAGFQSDEDSGTPNTSRARTGT